MAVASVLRVVYLVPSTHAVFSLAQHFHWLFNCLFQLLPPHHPSSNLLHGNKTISPSALEDTFWSSLQDLRRVKG